MQKIFMTQVELFEYSEVFDFMFEQWFAEYSLMIVCTVAMILGIKLINKKKFN